VIDWLMVFVGGLLGSSHCLGMCGAFTLVLGSRRSGLAGNLCRQTTYSLGRVFTYSMAGAAAGYGGWRLMAELGTVTNLQALLSIVAGILLITQGLGAAGMFRGLPGFGGHGPCPGAGFFAALLGAARLRSVFLGGVINGLLPCGLVYAYLALAASSGDMFRGWGIMAVFGAGTLPVMVLLGCGGNLITLASRSRLLQVAAWCVVLTGALTLARGVGFLQSSETLASSSCPLCD
jgi:uncharacterized protein